MPELLLSVIVKGLSWVFGPKIFDRVSNYPIVQRMNTEDLFGSWSGRGCDLICLDKDMALAPESELVKDITIELDLDHQSKLLVFRGKYSFTWHGQRANVWMRAHGSQFSNGQDGDVHVLIEMSNTSEFLGEMTTGSLHLKRTHSGLAVVYHVYSADKLFDFEGEPVHQAFGYARLAKTSSQ